MGQQAGLIRRNEQMKKMIKNIVIFFCFAAITAMLTACIDSAGSSANGNIHAYDREGFPITLPEHINTIISIGPSNTEILVALGLGDAIIQTDMYSANVPGIQQGISNLDLLTPDLEHIITLAPDIVFVTDMTRFGRDDDPLSQVTATGVTVIYMPSSASIADIKEDIKFMANVVGAQSMGERIIGDMSEEIDRIRAIGEGAAERRTVYFEISPPPYMVSFGTGTFLHEMIEIAGAVNIFADQESWIGVSDEVILEANPDIIITSVDFLDDPIGEMISRPGWDVITAVQNGDIFVVDTNSSNRPSHNIVRALREIAAAVHPNEF